VFPYGTVELSQNSMLNFKVNGHRLKHYFGEGGDSEIGGDGDGVVMVRSLSTSASGGREMECNTPKLGRSGIRVRGVLLQDQ
ncbi:hypothetical protein Tco_0395618, partial [Tanacetum coccineum]